MRVGLVLAAGRSRRFGAEDKLLAPFRGRPLAAWSAAAMGAVALDHRMVVTGAPAVAALFDGFEVLAGGKPESGQADSLRAGVLRAQALGATRLLVCLADMPRADAALMAEVLAACTDAQASAAWDGMRRMPPACFPAADLGRLAALTGDRGAGALLAALPETALVRVEPVLLGDVDTPGDLAALGGESA